MPQPINVLVLGTRLTMSENEAGWRSGNGREADCNQVAFRKSLEVHLNKFTELASS